MNRWIQKQLRLTRIKDALLGFLGATGLLSYIERISLAKDVYEFFTVLLKAWEILPPIMLDVLFWGAGAASYILESYRLWTYSIIDLFPVSIPRAVVDLLVAILLSLRLGEISLYRSSKSLRNESKKHLSLMDGAIRKRVDGFRGMEYYSKISRFKSMALMVTMGRLNHEFKKNKEQFEKKIAVGEGAYLEARNMMYAANEMVFGPFFKYLMLSAILLLLRKLTAVLIMLLLLFTLYEVDVVYRELIRTRS